MLRAATLLSTVCDFQNHTKFCHQPDEGTWKGGGGGCSGGTTSGGSGGSGGGGGGSGGGCDMSRLDLSDFCDFTVHSLRPLFCATEKCSQPGVPFDCFNVKLVNISTQELTGGFYEVKENILAPGTAVLHQWVPLDETVDDWAAGIISLSGPDLILWEPLSHGNKGSALQLPTLSLVSEYKPSKENSTTTPTTSTIDDTTSDTTGGTSGGTTDTAATTLAADTTTSATTTPATTSAEVLEATERVKSLELLYILDTHNTVKVDAWYQGRYQGFASFELQKNSARAWEPIFQNSSGKSFQVFFATTKLYDIGDLDLKNIFSS